MKPSNYHACATGDCPHDDDGECIEALALHADELYAMNVRQRTTIREQREILDKLPQCWQLTAGKLVQDCPLALHQRIYLDNDDRTDDGKRFAVEVSGLLVDEEAVGDVMTIDEWGDEKRVDSCDCANSPDAAAELRERSE